MSGARTTLERLADLRHRDPAGTRDQALALVDHRDPSVSAAAHWIVGLAEHELGDAEAAVVAYHLAIGVAAATGPDLDAAQANAQASMAVSLQVLGRHADADAAIGDARRLARGDERGFVGMLHGLVLQRAGRLEDAVEAYREAEPLLVAAGDDASLARLLLNRGILRAYQGDVSGSIADFDAAEVTARRLDLPVLVAMAAHNTGFARGRRGDVPGALEAFDRAATAYETHGAARLAGVLAADRCEVLLESGLVAEAREAANTAVIELGALREVAEGNEALLQAARADLAAGALTDARDRAREAGTAFRAARRLPWAALADYVAIQAEIRASEDRRRPPARLLAQTRRIARALEAEGWVLEAAHVRTYLGRIALATGRSEVARVELADARRWRSNGSPAVRVQAWHADALLHLADDDRAGALRAVRKGLAVVAEHRETLGASDLRANASARGADLAALGLRLAVEGGRPATVLQWAERYRAGALHRPAVRPPADPGLADELARLRQAHASEREATLAGSAGEAERADVIQAERRVRDRARQAPAGRHASPTTPSVATLRLALGRRTLVEYLSVDEDLFAVTVDARRCRLVPLGRADEVTAEVHHLRSGLRRLLRDALGAARVAPATATHGRAPVEVTSRRSVEVSAAQLDGFLLQPLGLSGDDELVIVPTGSTHGMAWAALPSLRGRPFTIAPSAALWCTDAPPASRTRALVVAGPDLPGALDEVASVCGQWPGSEVLAGADATADRVLEAMGRSELVHLAAHGTFRADSPLFSSLRLADGALTVYDLEGLDRPPRTVVLPACSAAAASVRSGDELLGTSAALLALGVRSVVAPVLAVPDHATARFSAILHGHLGAGLPVSHALARTATVLAADHDPLNELVAWSFLCMGADERPAGPPVSG